METLKIASDMYNNYPIFIIALFMVYIIITLVEIGRLRRRTERLQERYQHLKRMAEGKHA